MRHSWTLCLFLGFFAVSVHGDTAHVRLFPGVTHEAGSAASGSTVVLNNATVMPQSVLLELLTPGSAAASASRAVVLAPGERREIADLHAFLRAAEGVGMLRVTGSVAATVRLRDQDDEPVLKELPEVNAGQAIAPNEEVDFPNSTPADMERDVQSNLILVNLDRRDVTVAISQGSITARKTIPARAFVQIDNLGGFLGAPAGIASAHAVADGRWFGSIMTVRTLATGQRRRAVAPPEVLPSSFGLIDKALAAGTINADQALTYKVFADFGDSRLPASLKGDDSGVVEADSPGLAHAQWSTLSPATRDLIGPYLVPAFYAGSWWDLRRAGVSSVRPLAAICRPWDGINLCPVLVDWSPVEGKHVRVWYESKRPDDYLVASDLAKETDSTIWPELIRIMGREPILDHVIDGKNLLDVVLVDNLPPENLATTYSLGMTTLCAGNDATFIVVNRNTTDIKYRRSAFAHELFHSVEHAFDSKDCQGDSIKWLIESSATWFEDELYPKVDREHRFAKFYLSFPDLSIDDQSGLSADGIKYRNYGAYVFFFYLTRIRGADPTKVLRYVWQATEAAGPGLPGLDAIHALDAGLTKAGAPLEKSWPEFAVYSWNVAAPFNLYTTLDTLTDKTPFVKVQQMTVPAGDGNVKLGDAQLSLPHLSMQYFQIDFPDATASSVAFYNGIQNALGPVPVTWIANFGNILSAKPVGDPNSIKGAHVDALLLINGKWTHEDWTGLPFKTYCRDLTAERIDSLVIILSNSDIENTLKPQGKYPPIVQATNIGCYAWEGKADLTYIDPSTGQKDKITVTNLLLKASGDVPEDEATPLRRKFDVVNGTFDWSVSGANTSCGFSGAPIGNAQLADGISFLFTFPYSVTSSVTPASGPRGIFPELFFQWLTQRNIVKKTCTTGGGTTEEQVLWNAPNCVLITTPDDRAAQITTDGKSLTIDVSKLKHQIGGKALTGTWTFLAVRQQ